MHGEKTFKILTISKRTGWEDRAVKQIAKQTVPSMGNWVIVQEGLNAPPKIRVSNLNRSLNYGLQQIQSDYVIFYQDFIDLPKDCFEKLLEVADEKTFVTTATINADGTDDARFTGSGMVRRIRPEQWEANVSIAPMKIIRELGGFEEELDNGWSWDNVHLAQRAAMLGCRFVIDETNRPQLLAHEQTSKLKMQLNDKRCAQLIAEIRMGKRPIKCDYL